VIELSLGSFGSVGLPDRSARSLAAPSSSEMARLDAREMTSGTSSLTLMERAGCAVAEEARRLLDDAGGRARASALILCGPGNNGGDGLVVARVLADLGYSVKALIVNASRYSEECQAQASRVASLFALEFVGSSALSSPHVSISHDEMRSLFADASLIIDALLGTGQRDAPRGEIATLVSMARAEKRSRSTVRILSVDVPTGISADTGNVYEPHIEADRTVAIELLKRGVVQFPARSACGTLVVSSIGISDRSDVRYSLALGDNLPRLPRRALDSHKGSFGRVLIVGGSAGMPGASALAALGALRAGVALVTRTTRAGWLSPEIPPECMHALLTGDLPYYEEDDSVAVLEQAARAETVVLGPGLGRHPDTGKFVRRILEGVSSMDISLVVDADALYHVASEGLSLKGLRGALTPHPGEAASMLGCSTPEIQEDRFASVEALQNRYGGVVLLKGAGTLVYDGAYGRIVPRGTPYLATGGSGDVLCGIIAACMSRQTLGEFDATVAGAYIHAVAGERASNASGGPIIASDIAWAAASVVGELER
jgi:hydroxyethylthiazole kinase-like uncharacterized protein yjeF